jgi:hypothetical protein
MKWIITPIMRPLAHRKLPHLYAEQDRLKAAIDRARRAKSKVSDLYEMARICRNKIIWWCQWI